MTRLGKGKCIKLVLIGGESRYVSQALLSFEVDLTVEDYCSSRTTQNWRMLPLGSLGKWIGGGTPSKANPDFWSGGDIPWVSAKDMKRDRIDDAEDHITEDAVAKSSAKLVPAGSVLVVVRSGILRHTLPVAVTEREVALNQDLKAITPNKDIKPQYLAYALKAFEQELLQTCTKSGTTVQNIELPTFLRFEIPVAPIEEQGSIVAEIETQLSRLESGVRALKRAQANLKRYRAAVLNAACEGRLVPTEAELARAEGRKYESGAELLDRIPPGASKRQAGAQPRADQKGLPEGWTIAAVGQLFECVVPNRDKPKSFTGTIPWVTLPDYSESISIQASASGLGLTEAEAASNRAKIIPAGSVVMSCIGRFGLASVLRQDSVINQQLHAFLVPGWLCPEFIAYALRTQRSFMESVATSTTIAYLNKQNCNNIPVPLPPLAEQRRIVAEVERRLSVVDELEATIAANLRRATRLRQSVLSRAFRGGSESTC